MRRSAWDTRGDDPTWLRLVIRFLINALAVWIASHIIPGITPLDHLSSLALVALILGLVNALIKPVLRFLTCPLQILTIGLFTLLLNALMLGLTAWIAQRIGVPFAITGFGPALLGAIVISLVSWILTGLV
jgi:putative membrane protein